MADDLRRQVVRCPNPRKIELLHNFRRPQITNLCINKVYFDLVGVVDEYVAGFDIPMYNIIGVQVLQTFENLPKHPHYLFLCQFKPLASHLRNFLSHPKST